MDDRRLAGARRGRTRRRRSRSDAANNIGFSAPHTFTVDRDAADDHATAPRTAAPRMTRRRRWAAWRNRSRRPRGRHGDGLQRAQYRRDGRRHAADDAQRPDGAYTIDASALPEGTYGHRAAAGCRGRTGSSSAHVRRRHDSTCRDADEPSQRALDQDTTPTYNGTATARGDSTGRREDLRRSHRDRLPRCRRSTHARRSGSDLDDRRHPALAEGPPPRPQGRRRRTTPARAAHTFVVDTTPG